MFFIFSLEIQDSANLDHKRYKSNKVFQKLGNLLNKMLGQKI